MSCPLEVVGAHSDADFEHITSLTLDEPGEAKDVRFKLIANPLLFGEAAVHFAAGHGVPVVVHFVFCCHGSIY